MTAAISITSGWFPIAAVAAGLLSFLIAFDWGDRAWHRQVLIGIPLAGIIVALAAIIDDGLALIPWQFPNSYYFWVGLVVLSVLVCIIGWRAAEGWRRVVSVLSVFLTFVMAFTLINKQYQYYPTLSSLFGKNAQNQVALPQLAELQRQTAATGRLPTQGVTVELPIPGKVSGFRAADAFVWLPPVWFEKSAPKLPVIILLPGVPGEPSDWTRAAFADQTATRFANAHGGRAPILVMPDPNGSPTQDTECVDSPLGRAATYVNTDVVDFVRHEFDAATGEHSVAVGGLSAGGTCAMILGLRNPDEYTAIASYSGFASPTYQEDDRQQTIDILFGGSASAYAAHDPLQILRTRKFPQLSAWVETGSGDPGPLQDNEKLRPELEAAGVDTCWLVRPGGHDFDFWQTAFANSLPWLSARLGLTPEPASVPATCQR